MVVVGLFKPVVEAGSVKDVFANGDFSYLAPVYKLIKTDDAFFLLELINILIEFLFGHVTNHFFKLISIKEEEMKDKEAKIKAMNKEIEEDEKSLQWK